MPTKPSNEIEEVPFEKVLYDKEYWLALIEELRLHKKINEEILEDA